MQSIVESPEVDTRSEKMPAHTSRERIDAQVEAEVLLAHEVVGEPRTRMSPHPMFDIEMARTKMAPKQVAERHPRGLEDVAIG